MTTKKEIGNFGERIAKDYLKDKDYKILGQNFEKRWGRRKGEIDIIGKKHGKIIFFEVKTRVKSDPQEKTFFPEDEISFERKRQLCKMAQIYLSENKYPSNTCYQIDILAVELFPKFQKAKIRHHKNAIEDMY